jgi:uncharacterized protein
VKIRVVDISEKEKVLASSLSASEYPTLLMVQQSGECTFLQPVEVSLSIAREYDHIRVKGNVETSMALKCSRCLTDFTASVHSRFTIYFTKTVGNMEEDEVELAEEDLVTATYDSDEIDLTNEIAEQVLLEVPYKPLCRVDCHGLCPVCGVDRNVEACNCSDGLTRMAFSSLRGLKVKQ